MEAVIHCEEMTMAEDAYKSHNGVGRPGQCPSADEAYSHFTNFQLRNKLLIYCYNEILINMEMYTIQWQLFQ